MVHHSECPLCSSEKILLHLSCNDHFVSNENFDIYKCSSCGFIFTQDYPGEEVIGRYYESQSYISHSDTTEGFSNKLYRVARNIMLRIKRNLIKNITGLETGRILDIGSGTGYFAATMNKAGWTSEGIEINEKARDFSKTRFGIDIAPPEKIKAFMSSQYDCITLWHVLEHFHDPFSYMAEIKRLLKPGARCVIALPNSNSYDAMHYKRFWAAWDVPRHLWHFNPQAFGLFAEKAGLILVSMKVLPLDVFYISLMSEKYEGSALPYLKGMLKAVNFAFLTIFNKNRSSSIIYILTKPEVKIDP